MDNGPVIQCAQCGAAIVAPHWSECLSDHRVRNVWSCEDCGYEFEHTIYLPTRRLADVH
jgi:ribosomal protein L37AE/L43A